MHQEQEPRRTDYPHGRGYGHDYMRGGEVGGGYGYSERDDYQRPRGERPHEAGGAPGADPTHPAT